MKTKQSIFLFLSSILLISCVFTEELHLKNDGSGTYAFKMDMSEMMESMKGMSTKDSIEENKVLDTIVYFKDILAEQKDSISKLKPDEREVLEALKDFTMRMQVDENKGKMLMNFGLDFNDIADLKNMSEKIAKAQSLSDKKKASKNMPFNNDIDYSFKGNVFKRRVNLKKLSKEKSDDFEKMMTQSSAFMEGSTYRILYHFEKEIKNVSLKSAVLSNDRKTLTIEMPMDTVMKNPKLLDFEVELRK